MSRKTTLSDKPIGKLTRVKDFLPPPSQLVPREETVKVTLALSKESAEFFKEKAKKNKVPYQRMIRSLLTSMLGNTHRGGWNICLLTRVRFV
jgi:predicted DNA binding CopG/RHH family protein